MVHVLAQSQNLSSYYREILFCGELFLCFELKFHKIIVVAHVQYMYFPFQNSTQIMKLVLFMYFVKHIGTKCFNA